MKQNKFLSMLAVGLLALGFTACSDDNDLPNGGEQEGKQAQAYFQLSVASGNNAAMTKGDDAEDSGKYSEGTIDERKVHKAYVYFFNVDDDNAPSAFKKMYELTNFTTSDSNTSDTETSTSTKPAGTLYTSQAKLVETGTYFVSVLVNKSVKLDANATFDVFKDKTLELGGGIISSVSTDGIPMSSRFAETTNDAGTETTTYAIGKLVKLEDTHTQNNPLKLEMDVERSFAKIQLSAGSSTANTTDNKYTVYKDGVSPGTEIATVELLSYKLRNLVTEYYAFRRVASLEESTTGSITVGTTNWGAINTSAPYVIDPWTTDKNFVASTDNTNATVTVNSTVSAKYKTTDYTTMPTTTAAVNYCLENTMYKTMQKEGYVTAVVFKAKVTPKKIYKTNANATTAVDWSDTDDTSIEEVYYYNDEFYQDLQTLRKVCGLGTDVTDDNAASYGIYKYAKVGDDARCCYYSYWIKHYDNSVNTSMGEMEYAIVRNNDYRLKVTGVNLPGDTTDKPDDDSDVELKEAYIQVALSVNPWIVRSQNAVLGPQ